MTGPSQGALGVCSYRSAALKLVLLLDEEW